MNINWKLRLKNKVTLTAIILQAVTLVYALLGVSGIVPAVGEDTIVNIAYMAIELFCLLGIVVDPTTKGIKDSNQAQSYDEPK